jgi:hypothetical protein
LHLFDNGAQTVDGSQFVQDPLNTKDFCENKPSECTNHLGT